MGWAELHTIAGLQHGVVVRSDVVDCAVPVSSFDDRARREGWPRPYPGVTLLPGSPPGPLQDLWAALLATGGVAAGATAMWLHDRWAGPPRRPEVVVAYGRPGTGPQRRCTVRRSRTLVADHVTTVDGVPVTTLARTLGDVAPRLGGRRLLHEVVAAQRDGRLDPAALRDLLGALRAGTPGRGLVADVLGQLEQGRSDSGFEHDVRSGLRAAGFPVHPEPFPYRCEDGVVVHLDIALPDHMVYVETDGRRFHSAPGAFETDRLRWTQIVRAWRPVWVTWQRWQHQRAAVIEDVRRAIDLGPP